MSVEPPNTNTCSYCRRPTGPVHYLVQGRVACQNCATRIAGVRELNEFRLGPAAIGFLYGLMAAILCGFAWALILKYTGYQIGIAAIAVGYVVSRAILIGSNGRRGRAIQISAIGLSLAGVLIGRGLTVAWVFFEEFQRGMHSTADTPLLRVIAFVTAPVTTFEAFDLLWYGLAVYQAWRMTQPFRVNIQGPFGDSATMPPPMSPPPGGNFYTPSAIVSPSTESAPTAPRKMSLSGAIMLTILSAAVSVAVYAHEMGWAFALGSVLCIMIHELGHTTACVLYGLRAGPPIFIPYLGALISLRESPPDAKVEAVIGIAGPVGGLLATVICFVWFLKTHNPLAADLTNFSATINLFNLIPIHPLDGGRIARGVAPAFWGIIVLVAAWFATIAPKIGMDTGTLGIIGVATVIGIARTLSTRRGPYFAISAEAGWLMGVAYLLLTAVLMWMWAQVRNAGSIW